MKITDFPRNQYASYGFTPWPHGNSSLPRAFSHSPSPAFHHCFSNCVSDLDHHNSLSPRLHLIFTCNLEKEMATHSSTLAWRIPWREEPDRLQSMGSQRVGHDWVTSLHFTYKLSVHTLQQHNCWDCCPCSRNTPGYYSHENKTYTFNKTLALLRLY